MSAVAISVRSLLILGALLSASVSAAEVPRWLVRYYGDSDFCTIGGTSVVSSATFPDVCLYGFRTPRSMWVRGRAFVARSVMSVSEKGAWTFRLTPREKNNCVARLAVNGRLIDEQPQASVRLEPGEANLILYVREGDPARRHDPPIASFEIEAKAPSSNAFQRVQVRAVEPSELPPHDVAFDHDFTADEAIDRYYGYRSFKYVVPADGYYRVSVQMPRLPARLRLVLDDWEIRSWQHNAEVPEASYYGFPDRKGLRLKSGVDYFGCLNHVRYLKRGEHLLDLHVFNGGEAKRGNTEELLRRGDLRFGISRVQGLNPESDVGFWFENRDDLVYAVGETFKLHCGRPAAEASSAPYYLEVRRLGGTRSVASAIMLLDHQVRHFEFPCTEEGAYEFRVKNDRDEVVEGPWDFVVADDRPLKAPPRQNGAAIPPAATTVVDRVEVGNVSEARHFCRDNGTSRLFTNEVGVVYRETGTLGSVLKPLRRPADFRSKEWRRGDLHELRPGEKYRSGMVRAGTTDWFAYTLNVRHPGWTHIVRVGIPTHVERMVTAAAVDPKTGALNAWALHVGKAPASGKVAYLQFLAWPNTTNLDVLVVNATGSAGGRLFRRGAVTSVELLECEGGRLPPLSAPAGGWNPDREFGWLGEQGDLYVNERTMPPLWDGDEMIGAEAGVPYHSWRDLLISWSRFAELAAYRGDSFCSVPIFSYSIQLYQGPASRICFPGKDIHGLGNHAATTGLFSRDQFKLILMKASQAGVRIVADLMMQQPVDQAEFWARQEGRPEMAKGLFLSKDASGKPCPCGWTSTYISNPAHPVYRKLIVRYCEELARRYGRFPAFAGIRNRYWHGCPASFEPWWHSDDLGFDDWTVAQFASEKGLSLPAVGTNETAFAARREKIRKEYGEQWTAWRCEKVMTLRKAMVEAMRRHAPNAQLVTTDTKDWKRSAGLQPPTDAPRTLGYLSGQVSVREESTEMSLMDGLCFKNFNRRPAPYGHGEHSTNDWITCYPRDICCNSGYRSSPYHLKPLAEALASNQLNRVWAGGEWCLPPPDEALRQFIQVWRAIPTLEYRRIPCAPAAVVAYQGSMASKDTVVWLVNVTDRQQQVTLVLDGQSPRVRDLAGGVEHRAVDRITITLEPYQPAVWSIIGDQQLIKFMITKGD